MDYSTLVRLLIGAGFVLIVVALVYHPRLNVRESVSSLLKRDQKTKNHLESPGASYQPTVVDQVFEDSVTPSPKTATGGGFRSQRGKIQSEASKSSILDADDENDENVVSIDSPFESVETNTIRHEPDFTHRERDPQPTVMDTITTPIVSAFEVGAEEHERLEQRKRAWREDRNRRLTEQSEKEVEAARRRRQLVPTRASAATRMTLGRLGKISSNGIGSTESDKSTDLRSLPPLFPNSGVLKRENTLRSLPTGKLALTSINVPLSQDEDEDGDGKLVFSWGEGLKEDEKSLQKIVSAPAKIWYSTFWAIDGSVPRLEDKKKMIESVIMLSEVDEVEMIDRAFDQETSTEFRLCLVAAIRNNEFVEAVVPLIKAVVEGSYELQDAAINAIYALEADSMILELLEDPDWATAVLSATALVVIRPDRDIAVFLRQSISADRAEDLIEELSAQSSYAVA